MGREIKFRIWNKQKGKFLETTLPQKFHLLPSLYDVQQYTGLKDKNGTEIYEGDICQDSLNEKWQGKVYFEDACFYFGWENIVEPLSEVNNQLEVIGNIYENPELVK